MNKKIRWITETAIMLALLVTLQYITKPMGQFVTGSFVNAVLAVTVLVSGLYSSITVALISPILAYLLNIAPMLLTVPAIMIGNAVYIILLYILIGKRSNLLMKLLGWLLAAGVKFFALYAVVHWVICGLFNQVLPAPVLTTFSWPQLFTALIGGGAALLITPILRKALHK